MKATSTEQKTVKKGRAKTFAIGSIVVATMVLLDGSQIGLSLVERVALPVYQFFFEYRVLCLTALKKYNDALVENQIQTNLQGSVNDSSFKRFEAAHKAMENLCFQKQ